MAKRVNPAVWWGLGGVAALGLGWLGWRWLRRGQLALASGPVFPVEGANWPSARKLKFGFERSATHTHQGVDIAAPVGTPVYAMLGGEVVTVCNQDRACSGFHGYGKVVVVRSPAAGDRPTVWSLYAHLDRVDVPEGYSVAAGTQLGTVGRTYYPRSDPTADFSSGPHLHFEVSPRDYPQNSEAWRYGPQETFEAAEGTRAWASVPTSRGGPLLAGVGW